MSFRQQVSTSTSEGIVILSILAGSNQVLISVLRWWVPTLLPESDVLFIVKAFTAEVILTIRLVHIVLRCVRGPDITVPEGDVVAELPIYEDVAMVVAIGTLMIDSLMMSSSICNKSNPQLF